MQQSSPSQGYILTEVPYLSASSDYYRAIRHLPLPVWLDSGNSVYGRYDIISAAPASSLCYKNGTLEHQNASGESLPCPYTCPFDILNSLLEERLQKHRQYSQFFPLPQGFPFAGGAIGFMSYELGRHIEKTPQRTASPLQLPDMIMGFYDWAIIQDHKQQQSWLLQNPTADKQCIAEVSQSIEQLSTEKGFTESLKKDSSEESTNPFRLQQSFSPEQSKESYQQALAKIERYILAGDCYQVNYTQRFSAPYKGDLLDAYLTLRETVPSPYSAFIELGDKGNGTNNGNKPEQLTILSLSPEQFIEVKNRKARTRPIKGTSPRHDHPKTDKQAADALLTSPKDRAENVMIVDLLRNDFSKSCKVGTVKTPELFALQSFRNVHHLVSTVTGELRDEKTPVDLLKGCFPGGSITGAPKKRAMEIINELEPCQRSLYCGSVVYFSDCGRMDSNITIRTLLADNKNIHCWGGGGITVESNTNAEYQESLDKVTALMKALEKDLTHIENT
ncbi:MAG: aminodeoxychorismate synthase component I [Cellvibrionaceae bacterium]